MNIGEMTKPDLASGPRELAPTRESLLERLRDLDDHRSWQEFFDTYWKLIYCAAVKGGLSDDEAEEVVQETVIGVARRMDRFVYDPRACSFKGWLMHVTRCRIIDHLRKRQTRARALVPLTADTGTGGGGGVADPAAERGFAELWDGEWQKNLVDAAMERVKRRVDPEHYQIFYLHSVKNMSGKDIGELLGITAAKVYMVRLRIARQVKREVQELARRENLGTMGPESVRAMKR
jgi:RNA polymerase sigma-70 factor (ECF subfamily)